MLAQQEPFPAFVLARHWSLLDRNRGGVRLVEFLVGPLPANASVNLADALVAPDVLRSQHRNPFPVGHNEPPSAQGDRVIWGTLGEVADATATTLCRAGTTGGTYVQK